MQHRANDVTLEAPHLPGPRRSARLWRWLAPIAAVGLLVGWVAWYVTTPPALQTDDQRPNATALVGHDEYVGMFTASGDFRRSIHISGVKVSATASAQLAITPLICHHGTFSVTTDPTSFCASIDDPAGERLGAGDSIMLKLHSDTPVVANVDRIEVSFQEGFRWGTKAAGHAGATVSFLDSAS